jgi:hypothetical protein
VAARLARLRQSGADLDRRLRGDSLEAPDSESYWSDQIARWRAEVEETLASYPFQLRAMQAPTAPPPEGVDWSRAALAELAERRGRLDATIERLAREE